VNIKLISKKLAINMMLNQKMMSLNSGKNIRLKLK